MLDSSYFIDPASILPMDSNPEFVMTQEEWVEMANKPRPNTRYTLPGLYFDAFADFRYEYLPWGATPVGKTAGDTLFADGKVVLLGNRDSTDYSNIYVDCEIKSKWSDATVEVYTGPLAAPDFTTDKAALNYRTAIRNGCEYEGVNFAGHYTVVSWGCGTSCARMAIVDRMTGAITYSSIPFADPDYYAGESFLPTSRIMIVKVDAYYESDEPMDLTQVFWQDGWHQLPTVYEMRKGRLRQIEVCHTTSLGLK